MSQGSHKMINKRGLITDLICPDDKTRVFQANVTAICASFPLLKFRPSLQPLHRLCNFVPRKTVTFQN